MGKIIFSITTYQLFLPITAFIAVSKSYILSLRFKIHEMFQIN